MWSSLASWARGEVRPAVPPTQVCPVVPLEDVASVTGADMQKPQGSCGFQGRVPLVPSVPCGNGQVVGENDRLTISGWVPDPSRRVCQVMTEAEVDAAFAAWTVRNPGR